MLLIAALFVGGVLGFGLGWALLVTGPPQISPLPQSIQPETEIEEVVLPIPEELIEHPALVINSANIVGMIVEKNDTSFVIESDGHRLEILVDGRTEFAESSPDDPRVSVPYEDVPDGVKIWGSAALLHEESRADFLGVTFTY